MCVRIVWEEVMKIKITVTTIIIMMGSIAFGFACGSASAPPVDLPAPITGRIDVSAPDADGNVTITGTDGAVEGGSTVMAVNETVAGTQALKIIDLIVSSAWASDGFPSVCSGTGHACALADSNGAFVILLAASTGDSIAIGVINATDGEFISELTRKDVSTSCSGLGLSGATKGVVVAADGTPVLLKQGSDSSKNSLVIGSTSEGIEGCYANSIALYGNSDGTSTLAVTSKEDKKLWTGTLSGGNITSEKVFLLSGEPMAITFAGSASSALVAVYINGSITLAKYSLTGTTESTIEPAESTYPQDDAGAQIQSLTRSRRVDAVAMNNGDHLALAVTDEGDALAAYLTFFEVEGMRHLSTFATNGLYLLFTSLDDAKFWLSDSHYIKIVGISTGESRGAVASLWNLEDTQISISTVLADETYIYPSVYEPDISYGVQPTHIAVSNSVTISATAPAPMGIFTTLAGNAMLQSLPAAGDSGSIADISVTSGHDLVAIDMNDTARKAYAADATSGTAVLIEGLTWGD